MQTTVLAPCGRLSSWCRRCLEAHQSVRPPWFEGSCDFSGSCCTLRMLNQWTSGLLDVCGYVLDARVYVWHEQGQHVGLLTTSNSTAFDWQPQLPWQVSDLTCLFVCLGAPKLLVFCWWQLLQLPPVVPLIRLHLASQWTVNDLFLLTIVAKLDKQWNLKVLCKYVTMEFDAFSRNLAQLGADCSRETWVFSVPSFFVFAFIATHDKQCTFEVLCKCDNGIRSVYSRLGLFGCRIFKRDGGSHLYGFKTLDSTTLGFYSGPAFLTIYSGGCECNRLAGPYLWLALHRKFLFELR